MGNQQMLLSAAVAESSFNTRYNEHIKDLKTSSKIKLCRNLVNTHHTYTNIKQTQKYHIIWWELTVEIYNVIFSL